MAALRITLYLCFVSCSLSYVGSARYEPTWQSLDSRPLPSWYDEAKIGIFVYWGVFSVPSFHGEFLWWDWKGDTPVQEVVDYMQKNYPPDFTYADFASMFSAEFYNPDQWADLFNASGARYVVFNSKHPDGFTNWPSKYSFNWNSVDVGPSKDLVGMLADSIRRRTNLHFGLIYSLFEWFNPLFMQDEANRFQTDDYVNSKSLPELYDIVNRYKPELVWSDCDWLANDTYWKSKDFLAWLYNDSPVKETVVTNDRWGIGCLCQHGGYLTCADRYNPGTLQKRKWENALTIDKKAWGYRREAKLEDYLTMEDLTQLIAETVSCGGNILMDVGPSKDGLIKPIYEERLRQMGQWLGVNGEAIYGTKPWSYQNDTYTPNIWYTSKKVGTETRVYAIVLDWPTSDNLYLASPSPTNATVVTLLGYPSPISWRKPASHSKGIELEIPAIPSSMMPCQWAWVFAMDGLQN